MRTVEEAVIVGVADAPLRNGLMMEPGNVLDAQARVARSALSEAGLELSQVDGLFVAGL
jgi:hypothetical protein